MYDAERPIVVSDNEKDVPEIAKGLEELMVCGSGRMEYLPC
jgi:hypothetical protein